MLLCIYAGDSDEESCTERNLCEKVCTARCIEAEVKRLDFSACISCFNCIDVCPSVGLKYKAWWRKKAPRPIEVSEGRRTFINAALSPAVSAVLPRMLPNDTLAIRKPAFDESREIHIE